MASAASTGARPVEEGLRSLLRDAADHVRALVHLELALARDEARRAVASLRRGALLLAAGLLVAALGLLSLMAALVAALSTVWPLWLSATTVGVAFGIAGGVLTREAMAGLRLEELRPSATLSTLVETKEWLESRR